MAGTNQYRAFGTGVGANTLSYSAYDAVPNLISKGFQPGIAKSEEMNTVLRQMSVAVQALAGLAIQGNATLDMLDDGDPAAFQTKLHSGLSGLYIQDLSGRVAVSEFLGAGRQSIGATGWFTLPGDIIVQWLKLGLSSGSPSTTTSFSWPKTFPVACRVAIATPDNIAAPGWGLLHLAVLNVTRFDAQIFAETGSGGSVNIAAGRSAYIIAIGH